jgi:hypothetical protein
MAGTQNGREVRVRRIDDWLSIGGVRIHAERAEELAQTMRSAAAIEGGPRYEFPLVGVCGGLRVVRWPSAVQLHDHPDPLAHSGFSMNLDQTVELADEVERAGTVLVV